MERNLTGYTLTCRTLYHAYIHAVPQQDSLKAKLPLNKSSRKEREGSLTMGRAPCCDKAKVKKGPWSPEEDNQLREYIEKHGTGGNWIALPQKAGNYLFTI